MQMIENLLVVHNLDEQTTQAYDLKLGSQEYTEPLLKDHLTIEVSKAHTKGRSLGYYLKKDELAANDNGYKLIEEELESAADDAKVVTDQQPTAAEDGATLIDTTKAETESDKEKPKPSVLMPYDENATIFVEPMYLLSIQSGGVTHCMTLHLSLKKLKNTAQTTGKCMLALINRQRGKSTLIGYLRETLIN